MRKRLILLLILCLTFMSGCSYLGRSVREKKANSFLSEFKDEFLNSVDIYETLTDYSGDRIDETRFMTEQAQVFDTVFKPQIKVEMPLYDDHYETAKVTIRLVLPSLEVSETPTEFHSVDEWIAIIRNLPLKNEKIVTEISYVDGDWCFGSLQEVYSKITEGYDSLGILDGSGMPLNASASYYSELAVDTVWYDPLTAVPLAEDELSSQEPSALQFAFYFMEPLTCDFTYEILLDDDKVLYSDKVLFKDSVIMIIDLSCETLEIPKFEHGRYSVRLLYKGEEVMRSKADFVIT